jgi:plastocyanin
MRATRMLFSLAAAIAVAACGGGGGGGSPVQPAEQNGQVLGSVVDQAGAGIAAVPVRLHRTGFPDRNATTNAEGSYTFAAVAAGGWNVTAELVTGFEPDGALTRAVQVVAGGTATAPQIRMRSLGGSGPRVVSIADNEFNPTPLTIAAGETVRWVNGGVVAHNTTSPGVWASQDLPPGAAFERTFAQAGTFNYSCTLHPGMNGSVVVQ